MTEVFQRTRDAFRIRGSRDMARLCARCADEKKGNDIIAIDISEIDGAPAEWFIIVTCSSEQQIRAVAEYIEQETGRAGLQQPRSEGWESLRWVILDYFDVVVHLMRPEVRSFYKLESLWGDGRFYHLSADGRLIPVRSQS